MDKLLIELPGKTVEVRQTKGQPYLFSLAIDYTFSGYIDINQGPDKVAVEKFTNEELDVIVENIKKSYQK